MKIGELQEVCQITGSIPNCIACQIAHDSYFILIYNSYDSYILVIWAFAESTTKKTLNI